MSARQIFITQMSPEWAKWRSTGIGASDMAALFGQSPYKTARDLWFEKSGLGETDDEDKSYIFRKGHEAEAEIREMFALKTKIEMNPACFENEKIFLASLDGYDKKLGILEAKLVGKEALKLADEKGEIPAHHEIQIQAQLFASESDKAYWGGRAPKVKTGVVLERGRNEKMIKEIREKGLKFWEQVLSGKAPEMTADDTLFITDKDSQVLFAELIRLKVQKDAIDASYEELEEKVKALAIHPKTRCFNVVVSSEERSGNIDYKSIPEIKTLSEEYIEKFRKKATKYKKINFKKES